MIDLAVLIRNVASQGRPESHRQLQQDLKELDGGATFIDQTLQVSSTPDGWMLRIGSPLETGRVEILIPQRRELPIVVQQDSRAKSELHTFDTLFERGEYRAASLVAQHDLKLRSDTDVASQLTALLNAARVEQALAHFDVAEGLLDVGMQLLESTAEIPDEIRVRLLLQFGQLHFAHACVSQLGFVETRMRLVRALQSAKNRLPQSHPLLINCLTSLARLVMAEFDYDEAERLLQDALKSLVGFPDNHRLVAETKLDLARLYAYAERDDDAERLFDESIALHEVAFERTHPSIAEALCAAADFHLYNRNGRERAAELLGRAIEIWSAAYDADHPVFERQAALADGIWKVNDDDSSEGRETVEWATANVMT